VFAHQVPPDHREVLPHPLLIGTRRIVDIHGEGRLSASETHDDQKTAVPDECDERLVRATYIIFTSILGERNELPGDAVLGSIQ
jgi:hypothetical protein